MDWNNNILPDKVSRWVATNATVAGNTITLNPGGEARATLMREEFDYLPDYLQITLQFTTAQVITNYEPRLFVRLELTDSNDNIYTYVAWMNQTEMVDKDTWLVRTVVDIDESNLKYLAFVIYADSSLTEPIIVNKRELRTSVALSTSQQDAISTQLPSIIFFSNTTAVEVTSAVKTVTSSSFQLASSSNLLVHLILSGVATHDCEITISFQLNNTDVQYSPMKHRIQAGNFIIGIPGSLLQVGDGNNLFNIALSCNVGTISFAKDRVYGTLDGKNILGGYNAEVPHAEIVQLIRYLNIAGKYDIYALAEIFILDVLRVPLEQAIPYTSVLTMHEVITAPSVDITIVAIQERFRDDGSLTRYEHDEYIELDGNVQFRDNLINKEFELIELAPTATIYGIDIDNTSVNKYEAFSIVPLENTITTSVEPFDNSDYTTTKFVVADGNIRIKSTDIYYYTSFVDIAGGKVAEVALGDYKEIITIE